MNSPPLIMHVCFPVIHCPPIVAVIAAGIIVITYNKSTIATCRAKKNVVCFRCLNLMTRKMISPVRLKENGNSTMLYPRTR